MIRLFVFDLGNVILPFEHRQIAHKLCARSTGKTAPRKEEVFQYLFDETEGLVNAYEEGLFSSAEFYGRIRDRYNLNLDFEGFAQIWNPIFREDEGVSDVIRYLKERGYPVFLLSNTNELHFSHIIEHYPIVHLMDEWILSFEVGVKKPEKRIFEVIFEKMNVEGSEVFYTDDVERYVEVARGLGIDGMVFKDVEGLREALRSKCI
jgi:glucose-1-phosphatase